MAEDDAASLTAMAAFLREYELCHADQLLEAEVTVPSFPHYLPTAINSDNSSTDDTTSVLSSNDSGDDNRNTAQEYQRPIQDPVKRRQEIANAKAAKRRLRYLNKLKDEKATLKRQERELVAQLSLLHKQEMERGDARRFELGVWRSFAVRQREWRTLAEQQQQQLKIAVLTRANLIHQMTELLQLCRLKCQTDSSDGLDGQPPAESDRKQKSLFRTFLRELGSLYAQTNSVIGSMDIKLAPPLTYRLTRDWNKDMTYLQSANATVIPFGFEQTSRALSSLMLTPGYGGESAEDDNTATRAYQLDFSDELGYSATLLVYMVVRRYVEAGRVVFVWRALAEGQDEFEGLYTDESAWFVLWPLPPHTDQGPAVVLESYTRLVPIGFDLKSDSDERANRFIEILVRADETDVNDMKQMMAKLLLDEGQDGAIVHSDQDMTLERCK